MRQVIKGTLHKAQIRLPHLEHGFNWFRIVCLVFAILVCFGVRYGVLIVPQVRQTADKVASLNNLQKADIKCHFGCGSFNCLGMI